MLCCLLSCEYSVAVNLRYVILRPVHLAFEPSAHGAPTAMREILSCDLGPVSVVLATVCCRLRRHLRSRLTRVDRPSTANPGVRLQRRIQVSRLVGRAPTQDSIGPTVALSATPWPQSAGSSVGSKSEKQSVLVNVVVEVRHVGHDLGEFLRVSEGYGKRVVRTIVVPVELRERQNV